MTYVYIYGGDTSSNIYNFFANSFPNTRLMDYPENKINCVYDTKLCVRCNEQNCTKCHSGNIVSVKLNTLDNFDYIITLTAIEDFLTKTDGTKMIIVKDTTVTTQVDTVFMNEILDNDLPTTYDIFYLSKWLDKAEKYNIIKEYSGGTKLIRNFSPHGLQAFVLSKKAATFIYDEYNYKSNPVLCRPFSRVINNLIENGTLESYSTTPLLFNFDTTNITANKSTLEDNNDKNSRFSYLKNCEVQGNISPDEPLNRRFTDETTFFWLFIILIIIVLTILITKKYF